MKLIKNGGENDHEHAIAEVLADAQDITVSVAFLKRGGAEFLAPILKARLKEGAEAVAFIGTDFYITEPDALQRLLKLQDSQTGFQIFLGDRKKDTFHPKAYVGRSAAKVRCLIGSANLTGGALRANDELSLSVEVEPNDALCAELEAAFSGYRSGGRFQPLDSILLEQYRSRFDIAQQLRDKMEKDIEETISEPFDLRRLDKFQRDYLADADAAEDLQNRRRNRVEARKVQLAICAMAKQDKLNKADKDAVREHLRDLMSSNGGRHLWSSSDIHRRGLETLNHPKAMVALFELGRTSSALPLSEGYAIMRKAAEKAPGVGLNMITEILCTFAPRRYAVLNGNTSGALAAVGVSAPKSPALDNMRVERYARLSGTIDALRARIGGSDFEDADAFLNWVYQRIS